MGIAILYYHIGNKVHDERFLKLADDLLIKELKNIKNNRSKINNKKENNKLEYLLIYLLDNNFIQRENKNIFFDY